jgi:hypothetical protein
MKCGMVLVVLAMVTGIAFAKDNKFTGDGDGFSWCDDDNWDRHIPGYDDGDKAKLGGGDYVVVDDECFYKDEDAPGAEEVEMRGDSSLTITADVDLVFDKDLAMSDGGSSDYTTLDIQAGSLTVESQCKDLAEDGDICVTVAAGTSLTFEDGVYLGDSNDGEDSVYCFHIAGDFAIEGDRLEHRGGQLIVDLTDGSFTVEKTSRLSMAGDSVATFNISGGTAELDKVELNESVDDFDYSLAINLSGDGTWDGSGEEIKDNEEEVIVNIDVTGNGTFIIKDLSINDDDSEVNITMDGGLVDIQDDLDMTAGDIVIAGGVFYVNDDFKLGDGVVDIKGDGQLVLNDFDSGDFDDIEDMIADGQLKTTSPGKYLIWDYDVTNSGATTVQAVYPFEVDIKPGGCPNPLRVNFDGRGVFPVAIVGSDTFDVTTIDPGTVTLIGVPALRSRLADVSTAGEICDAGPDGIADLTLKFSREAVLVALEDLYGDIADIPNRQELSLVVLAEADGEVVGGADTLVVLNRGRTKPKK